MEEFLIDKAKMTVSPPPSSSSSSSSSSSCSLPSAPLQSIEDVPSSSSASRNKDSFANLHLGPYAFNVGSNDHNTAFDSLTTARRREFYCTSAFAFLFLFVGMVLMFVGFSWLMIGHGGYHMFLILGSLLTAIGGYTSYHVIGISLNVEGFDYEAISNWQS